MNLLSQFSMLLAQTSAYEQGRAVGKVFGVIFLVVIVGAVLKRLFGK